MARDCCTIIRCRCGKADGGSSDEVWPRVQIENPYTRDAVARALRGASEWLTAPRCQSIFVEFHDERGLPLTQKLQELGASPQSFLRMLFVLDGEQQTTCRRDGVLAFTARGSRAIYVCGRDFERAWRRNPREVFATVIHEVLDSVGLGERPPTPTHITDRVQRLCWQ